LDLRTAASAVIRHALFCSFENCSCELRNLSTGFYKRSSVFDDKMRVSYAAVYLRNGSGVAKNKGGYRALSSHQTARLNTANAQVKNRVGLCFFDVYE
jgi:hypothetical protein